MIRSPARRTRLHRHQLAIAVSAALAGTSAEATVITADGSSCTLVDAITAANGNAPAGGCLAGDDSTNGGDTIELTADAYTIFKVHNNIDGPNGLPVVDSTITINGNGATILRSAGSPAFRLFNVASGALTVNGTTIAGGSVPGNDGGGFHAKGELILNDSTITRNTARNGGGISTVGGGTVTFMNGTVTGNTASGSGGGIHATVEVPAVHVLNSTVATNTASRYGGGICAYNSILTIGGSTIEKNKARAGGGIATMDGVVASFNDSLVRGNAADVDLDPATHTQNPSRVAVAFSISQT